MKGDADKEALLRQSFDETKELMDKAQAATAEEYSGSDRWFDHHRSTVNRLAQLCSSMDKPAVPNGAVIQLTAPKMLSRLDQVTEICKFQRVDEQTHLLADVKALLGE